jgi:hypothetical protein
MLVRALIYVLVLGLLSVSFEHPEPAERAVSGFGISQQGSHTQQDQRKTHPAAGTSYSTEGSAAASSDPLAPKAVVRKLRPDEDLPSYLGSTFSEDTRSFATQTRYGVINFFQSLKNVAFSGQLGVTKKETKAISYLVVSPDPDDSVIFSSNAQFIVDDGFFICRMTSAVDVLYGALGGVSFFGVGAEGGYEEGLSYRTNHMKCFGKIELARDSQGRKIGAPVTEVEDYCERCTGGLEGETMKEMMEQTRQRAQNQTTFHIDDSTCDSDDDCYNNDLRYNGRCILKSEKRKSGGKEKVYYYRRCEDRIVKNGYCNPEDGTYGQMQWFGPRKCDAGLKCTFISKKWDWWNLRHDIDYKCLRAK